jgi:hypothetical protein
MPVATAARCPEKRCVRRAERHRSCRSPRGQNALEEVTDCVAGWIYVIGVIYPPAAAGSVCDRRWRLRRLASALSVDDRVETAGIDHGESHARQPPERPGSVLTRCDIRPQLE